MSKKHRTSDWKGVAASLGTAVLIASVTAIVQLVLSDGPTGSVIVGLGGGCPGWGCGGNHNQVLL